MNESLTLDRIIEIGLGHMRFDPISFFEMTIDDFECAVRGFHELNEIREQQNWERTRWLATIILQPHTKKNQRLRPTDIAQFPWEQPKQKSAINGESLLQQMMK